MLFALRERGWLDERVEKAVWRQLKGAYREPFELFDSKDELAEALSALDEPRVFLMPEATRRGIDLGQFDHPEPAVYIFGNAYDSLLSLPNGADRIVTVYTPKLVDLFAVNIAAIVLHDREQKRVC